MRPVLIAVVIECHHRPAATIQNSSNGRCSTEKEMMVRKHDKTWTMLHDDPSVNLKVKNVRLKLKNTRRQRSSSYQIQSWLPAGLVLISPSNFCQLGLTKKQWWTWIWIERVFLERKRGHVCAMRWIHDHVTIGFVIRKPIFCPCRWTSPKFHFGKKVGREGGVKLTWTFFSELQTHTHRF